VAPELAELLLEQVGLGQPAVAREEGRHGGALVLVQIPPAAQQEPALTADEPARVAAVAEGFEEPRRLFLDSSGWMAGSME
jgi:hypothetical protein